MKNKLNFAYSFILTFLILLCIQLAAKPQTIELNTKQDLVISGTGFFPFDSISNQKLKDIFPTNPVVSVEITGFVGGPFTIVPAKDFSAIGPTQEIKGNGTFQVDYSMASSFTTGDFGLSIAPLTGLSVFSITARPPVVSTSSSSSSSSGATISVNQITPNAVTAFSNFLADDIANQLLNKNPNSKCESFSSSLNVNNIQSVGLTTINNLIITQNTGTIALLNSKEAKQKLLTNSLDQKLTNTTGITKIFATAIYPSQVENITTFEQSSNISISHSLTSKNMTFQTATNGGFFTREDTNCITSICYPIEDGLLINSAPCTAHKLTKKKVLLSDFNSSTFFTPFEFSGDIVQLTTSKSISKKPQTLASKVNSDSGYIILQTVPPKAKFTQKLKLSIEKD